MKAGELWSGSRGPDPCPSEPPVVAAFRRMLVMHARAFSIPLPALAVALVLREQVRRIDLAENLTVDDDRDGLIGTVIDVVAVPTRRLVGIGIHLDLPRA